MTSIANTRPSLIKKKFLKKRKSSTKRAMTKPEEAEKRVKGIGRELFRRRQNPLHKEFSLSRVIRQKRKVIFRFLDVSTEEL